MKREDILSLSERVKRAKRELEELKRTPQPMAGDSFLFYRAISEDDWDIEVSGITSTTWQQIYKVSVDVVDPERGFANMYYTVEEYDFWVLATYLQPVPNEPHSFYLKLYHVTGMANPGGLKLKFFGFDTQRGTINVELVSSTP